MLNPCEGEGIVTAAFGRHYEITLADGRVVNGIPRGKKSLYACGDRVRLGPLHEDGAHLLSHAPRSTLLYRSDAWKQKLIAANATQLVLVVATEPGFSDELVSRCLVATRHQGMRILILLNKIDITAGLPTARMQLAPFAAIGVPIIELSAKSDVSLLLPRLAGEISVLAGQSGMGKSTIVNAIVPGASAATREISAALDAGKHTTTHARLYRLPQGNGAIIDSPGLQAFGLAHLSRGEIEMGFAEFAPHLERCRFRNCRHENEPECGIKAAVAKGVIAPQRLAHFCVIARENEGASRA